MMTLCPICLPDIDYQLYSLSTFIYGKWSQNVFFCKIDDNSLSEVEIEIHLVL